MELRLYYDHLLVKGKLRATSSVSMDVVTVAAAFRRIQVTSYFDT